MVIRILNRFKKKIFSNIEMMKLLIFKNQKRLNKKKKIFFWSMGGMTAILMVEALIAKSLEVRGHDVSFIICDGSIKACIKLEENKNKNHNEQECFSCKKQFVQLLKKIRLKYIMLNELANNSEYSKSFKIESDIEKLKTENINIGLDIKASLVRYMQGKNYLSAEENIKKMYAESALKVLDASKTLIEIYKPDIVVMSHGVYVDWGPALKNFLNSKIKVITWCAAYDKCKFFISGVREANNADPHLFGDEKVFFEKLKKDVVESSIDKFFHERYFLKNSFDMKENNMFLDKQSKDMLPFFRDNKPIWGIFTHINWDAPENFIPMLYSSFNEWIIDTLKVIINDKKNNYIVRIHPAEKWCNDEGTGVEEYIYREFSELPAHIKIIGKHENISSINIYEIIRGGITVFGTPGIELSMLGKPVILAGKPSYAQRGFTLDSHSKEEYRERLKNIEQYQLLDETKVELAKKVAYVYFIKKQVPIYMLYNKNSQWWDIQFDKLSNILPGKDPIIDFICEQIIDGGDFVLSEELVELSEDENYKRKYGVM